MTFVVGLTGGIASGKSAVGSQFKALGVPVLDADQVSRDVVKPGSEGLTAVVAHFGPDILDSDGNLDRRRMRERVFSHQEARRELEAILHPLIRRGILEWRDQCSAPYCVLMVPMLVKMGWHDLVDRLLVVDCPVELQLERLLARDDIDPALAQSMIAAQDTREQRQQAADDLILNNGSLEELSIMTQRCHKSYLDYAQGRSSEIEALHLPDNAARVQ